MRIMPVVSPKCLPISCCSITGVRACWGRNKETSAGLRSSSCGQPGFLPTSPHFLQGTLTLALGGGGRKTLQSGGEAGPFPLHSPGSCSREMYTKAVSEQGSGWFGTAWPCPRWCPDCIKAGSGREAVLDRQSEEEMGSD